METLVLLDIDGVVLPARYPWTTVKPRGLQKFDLVIPPFSPTTVRVRPYVVETLKSWHAQGVDIRWLSSWGWKAKYLACAIGLPDFDVFYDPSPAEIFMYARSQRPWKRFAITDAAEDKWKAPVRIIWIDDEPLSGHTEQLEEFLTELHPNLAEVKLVRPDGERGLLLSDLRLASALLGVGQPDPGGPQRERAFS